MRRHVKSARYEINETILCQAQEGMETMKTTLTTLLAASTLLATPHLAFAQGYGYGGYGDHPMMWGNWFMGPMMMLFMVVIVVVAVVLILKLFGDGGTAGKGHVSGNAMAILNERFAKGEIDKAEYEDRKKTMDA